jgi:hypothetical protein
MLEAIRRGAHKARLVRIIHCVASFALPRDYRTVRKFGWSLVTFVCRKIFFFFTLKFVLRAFVEDNFLVVNREIADIFVKKFTGTDDPDTALGVFVFVVISFFGVLGEVDGVRLDLCCKKLISNFFFCAVGVPESSS